jgi:hypothetical protein
MMIELDQVRALLKKHPSMKQIGEFLGVERRDGETDLGWHCRIEREINRRIVWLEILGMDIEAHREMLGTQVMVSRPSWMSH